MEDKIERESNMITLDKILFHLEQATRFCNDLNLFWLSSFERSEWESRIKLCKNALEFTNDAVQQLKHILERSFQETV